VGESATLPWGHRAGFAPGPPLALEEYVVHVHGGDYYPKPQPLVPLRLDAPVGVREEWAVLDSGCDETVIPWEVAVPLGFTAEMCGLPGEARNAGRVLSACQLTRGLRVMVCHRWECTLRPHFLQRGTGHPVLLGLDFFDLFKCTLDGRARTLTLEAREPGATEFEMPHDVLQAAEK